MTRILNEKPSLQPQPPLPELPGFDLRRVMTRVGALHPDWPDDRLVQAELGYRRFVARAKSARGEMEIPESDVDEVWHAHILFTEQYHEDFDGYLGFYFHHRPFDKASCSHGCQGGPCGGACTSCGAGTITAHG